MRRLPRSTVRPISSRVAATLGILWALPLTVFGLLLAAPILALRGRMERVRGATPAILVQGPAADWMLRHHPFGRMNAMAIGHVVVGDSHGLTMRTLVHELTHVRQAARWGIFFPFAYLASSAAAVLRGQDAYWHNRFEIAARQSETQP